MNRDVDVARLVSQLMANATTAGERRGIAVLADAGYLDDADFRRQCLRMPKGVLWQRVDHMRLALPDRDPRKIVLEQSSWMAKSAMMRPPESLEALQIAINVDEPDGIQLAAWRDAYVADPREPNPYHHHIDLCLDELRFRFECWNCGRPAIASTDDDLPVCAGCREEA